MARRWPTFTEVRTALLFGGGLCGVGYVTLVDQTDRPTLLILFAAMMGLPLFLRSDEKHPPPALTIPGHPMVQPPPPAPPGPPDPAEAGS